MKIKTLFKTIFCAGLALALVLYLCHLYGNYIEKTQEPITDYTYIIHSGFISGYQNRYGDNLKPPTNVYHRMTA